MMLVANFCRLTFAAPAPLHPVSRTFLMFYSLTTQFDITEWMTRVTAFKGRLELFANMLSRALEILRFVVSDLAPAGILLYAPDVLSFKIAKSAYLLAKVGRRVQSGVVVPILTLTLPDAL